MVLANDARPHHDLSVRNDEGSASITHNNTVASCVRVAGAVVGITRSRRP